MVGVGRGNGCVQCGSKAVVAVVSKVFWPHTVPPLLLFKGPHPKLRGHEQNTQENKVVPGAHAQKTYVAECACGKGNIPEHEVRVIPLLHSEAESRTKFSVRVPLQYN